MTKKRNRSLESGNNSLHSIFWIFIAVLSGLRLVGLSHAPPGFYVDEAAGAAHVLCISQTGSDVWNQSHPLFSSGLGGGFYTAPYLYGQVIWTRMFGESIQAFRSFPAVLTLITLLMLYLWVRKKASAHTARWVLLCASICPWGFQFSRIAWDPPLAPFFLMLGLWILELPLKKGLLMVFSAMAFAFAAYAYPPERAQVLLLLCLLPGVSWKEKGKISFVFLILLIPLFMKMLDPLFMARAKMLAIWSDYPGNPFHDAGIFGVLLGFVGEFFSHFSFSFLFQNGDRNLRHSIQAFGMLSYLDGMAYLILIFWCIHKRKKILKFFSDAELKLIWISIVGVVSGIIPAALTWEGSPHALRAIGAWLFFSLFSGVIIAKWSEKSAVRSWFVLSLSLIFAINYNMSYFNEYPKRAVNWFQIERQPLGEAYNMMTQEKMSCEEARLRIKN